MYFYISLRHAPVKVGSAVVGAMNCVFIAIEGVAIGEQMKKGKYTMIHT